MHYDAIVIGTGRADRRIHPTIAELVPTVYGTLERIE